MDGSRLVELTAAIVSAHLSVSRMRADGIPDLLRSVHGALSSLDGGVEDGASVVDRPPREAVPHEADAELVEAPVADGTAEAVADAAGTLPVVSPADEARDAASGFVRKGRRTLFDDHLVCLEDDRDVVLLSRHLGRMGVSPDEYRTRWQLPRDYPMVSPRYSRGRSEVVSRTRFGRKPEKAGRKRSSGTLHPSFVV